MPDLRVLRLAALSALLGACRDDPSPGPSASSAPPGPVVELEGGVTIQDLSAGAGEAAADGRWVALHYDGTIAAIDGAATGATAYDSTRLGEPLVAKLGGAPLLGSFSLGVLGMREGGSRRITIPPALAYGELGKGRVPPGATLVYEVTLVDVFERSASGLHHRVVAAGEGAPPRRGQRVALELRVVSPLTGRELMSTASSGRPLEFVLGEEPAVPGLEEALGRMAPGARWVLALPPELAWGPRGHGLLLAPGQDVLIHVELLRVLDR